MLLPDLSTSPFQRYLGLELLTYGDGGVKLRLPVRDDLLRQKGSDWVHGGVLCGLVDIAGAYAVAIEKGMGHSTVDLRIDYLRPATGRSLLIVGKARKIGKNLSVADVEIHDENAQLLVIGRCLYAVAVSPLGVSQWEPA